VLGQFSYANLELVNAEGFTRELGLDPRRLDDAAIESIRQRVQNAGIFVSSLDLGGNHIDPDPAKRETQNQSAMKMTELAGKLGVAYRGASGNHQRRAACATSGSDRPRVYREVLPAVREIQSAVVVPFPSVTISP